MENNLEFNFINYIFLFMLINGISLYFKIYTLLNNLFELGLCVLMFIICLI